MSANLLHMLRTNRRPRCLGRWPATLAAIFAALFLATCEESDPLEFFQEVDTEPIEATIKTAVPLSYAAAAVAAVLLGETPPNVTVVDPWGNEYLTTVEVYAPHGMIWNRAQWSPGVGVKADGMELGRHRRCPPNPRGGRR